MSAGGTNCGSVKKEGRRVEIVLVGGITRRGYKELPSSTVIIYDIASDTWMKGRL